MHNGQYVYAILANSVDDPIGPFNDFANVRCTIFRHNTS